MNPLAFIQKYAIIAAAIGSALVTGGVTYGLTSWYYGGKLAEQKTQLEQEKKDAVDAANNTCAENRKITENTSAGLQKDLNTTRSRLAALNKRLREQEAAGACVPITKPAAGHDAAASGNVPFVQGGVVVESLTSAAADADETAARLVACQSFIKDTWSLHQYKAKGDKTP